MRLPTTAHTSRTWRIHEIAQDFAVEDVWALPTPGGAEAFPELLALLTATDPEHGSSAVVRALFAIRWKVGELLGWDGDASGVGARVATLGDRLPSDLREGSVPPGMSPSLPFRPLYVTDNEYAAEIANRTMHGVLHLSWVPDGSGGYRGQMAVLVKRNGLLGHAYMAAILPFRHLIVYPRMLDEIGRRWRRRQTQGHAPRPRAGSGAGRARRAHRAPAL